MMSMGHWKELAHWYVRGRLLSLLLRIFRDHSLSLTRREDFLGSFIVVGSFFHFFCSLFLLFYSVCSDFGWSHCLWSDNSCPKTYTFFTEFTWGQRYMAPEVDPESQNGLWFLPFFISFNDGFDQMRILHHFDDLIKFMEHFPVQFLFYLWLFIVLHWWWIGWESLKIDAFLSKLSNKLSTPIAIINLWCPITTCIRLLSTKTMNSTFRVV